jgi:hypothetical protein
MISILYIYSTINLQSISIKITTPYKKYKKNIINEPKIVLKNSTQNPRRYQLAKRQNTPHENSNNYITYSYFNDAY